MRNIGSYAADIVGGFSAGVVLAWIAVMIFA
jgi:hypothetical protein